MNKNQSKTSELLAGKIIHTIMNPSDPNQRKTVVGWKKEPITESLHSPRDSINTNIHTNIQT